MVEMVNKLNNKLWIFLSFGPGKKALDRRWGVRSGAFNIT